MGSSGLNVNLPRDQTPCVLTCGGETIEIRYSPKDSKNCRVINIRAPINVNITTPHTLNKCKEFGEKISQLEACLSEKDKIIKQLEKENAELKARLAHVESELKEEQLLVNNCLHHDLNHFFMDAIKKRIKERKEFK